MEAHIWSLWSSDTTFGRAITGGFAQIVGRQYLSQTTDGLQYIKNFRGLRLQVNGRQKNVRKRDTPNELHTLPNPTHVTNWCLWERGPQRCLASFRAKGNSCADHSQQMLEGRQTSTNEIPRSRLYGQFFKRGIRSLYPMLNIDSRWV